jgi:hypothetical protein
MESSRFAFSEAFATMPAGGERHRARVAGGRYSPEDRGFKGAVQARATITLQLRL